MKERLSVKDQDELREEVMKLKNVCVHLEEGTWVPSVVLKCMYTDFVSQNIKRSLMPAAVSRSLVFLLKRGYVEIRPTQAGLNFTDRYLKLYRQRERGLADSTKERRRMRLAAQKGTFCLDKVVSGGTSFESYVTIYGYYDDIKVEVNSSYKYVKLKRRSVLAYVSKGKLYEKILSDIAHALMAPEGRMWLVKVGVNKLKWFVKWQRGR